MLNKEIIIIGGGIAGYTLALRLARYEKKVLLIEKGQMGGVCLNAGCIPTKAFLYGNQNRNWRESLESQSRMIESTRQNIEAELISLGVEICYGQASFSSEITLSIKEGNQEHNVEFELCIVATGSKSKLIPQAHISGNICTSSEFLKLEECPQQLIIIGGGIIGIEAAEICSHYGGDVTVLEAGNRILPGWDDDIVNMYMRTLKEKRIQIHTNALIEEIEDDGESCICVFKQFQEYEEKQADKVLLAVGRESYIDNLDLCAAKVEFSSFGIKVDKTFRTSNPRIFAIGDCISGEAKLAHMAEYQAFLLSRILLDRHYVKKEGMPICCYSNPQMMQIFRKANTEHLQISKKSVYRGNPTARIRNEQNCMIKMTADSVSHEITGFFAIGNGVSEFSGEGAVIINNQMKLEDVAYSIHMHPTINEEIHHLARELLEEAEQNYEDHYQ